MGFRNGFNFRGRDRDSARHTPNSLRQPSRSRLTCEALEDRAVPASLSVNDVVILEGDTGTQNAVAEVRLSAPSNKTVTVNYSTSNGSAVAGSDYDAVSGKLTFAPGQTIQSIVIPVKGDREPEPDETLFITLRKAHNATIGDGFAVVSILDNEPRFSINSASVVEGNAGTSLITFTVSLAVAYDQVATVNYATEDYTATVADGDYLATAGTLTFAPGEVSKEITVVVNGDTTPESYEAFVVSLSGASANASIAVGHGSGGIIDDDGWVEPEADPWYYDYGYADYGWWYGYWSNSNTGPGEYY